MRILFAFTLCTLLIGSYAFIGEVKTFFENLGHELGEVGKDLLKASGPVAQSLLTTLTKAGTDLLTESTSDLLHKAFTAAGIGKRDLSGLIQEAGELLTKGDDYIKQEGQLLAGAFMHTVSHIQNEIENVISDVKPLDNLINEVKDAIDGHNGFVDDLIQKAKGEAMSLFDDVLHLGHNKRDLAETAHAFGQSLEHLLQKITAPLKSALSEIVTALESKMSEVVGLLG